MMQDVLLTGKKAVLHEVYFEEFLRHEMLKVGNNVANQITFEDKEKFWVPCLYEEPDTGNVVSRGEILISVHMLTKDEAEQYPQGDGREEPNTEPYCPPPEGRIKLTMNPFELLTQLIPAKMWRLIAMYACMILCCGLCIMMAPMIFSNLITKAIVG